MKFSRVSKPCELFLFFICGFCVAARGSNYATSVGASRVHTLVGSNPLATTGATTLKYPTHFSLGCEFTISTWVWLWRQKRLPNHENVIWASRKTPGDSSGKTRLLPSVIFNGIFESHFFFSLTREENGNYANGLWSRRRFRYYEWFHITFSIGRDYFSVYINGELQGTRSLNLHPGAFEDCAAIRNEARNNTILQIGGSRHLRSMSGMLQNFMILEGIALTEDQVLEHIRLHPPPELKTLQALLREYGIDRLGGYSPKDFSGTFYGEIQWSLCPAVVCGEVCMDDSFYLPLPHEAAWHGRSSMKESKNATSAQYPPSLIKKSMNRGKASNKNVKEVQKNKYSGPEGRKLLRKLAEGLKDVVLRKVENLEMDYLYDEDVYLDVYSDDLLTEEIDLDGVALEDVTEAQLNAINLWLEARLDGYELELDDFLDVTEHSEEDIQHSFESDLVDENDRFEGLREDIADFSSAEYVVSPGGEMSPISSGKRSDPPRRRRKSILPRKPKWSSRFLDSRKEVITEEASVPAPTGVLARAGAQISSIVEKVKFLADAIFSEDEKATDTIDSIESDLSSTSVSDDADDGSDYYELYKEAYPEVSTAVIQVQELYDSALLWLNGRHMDFSKVANLDLDDWIVSTHESSQSALFLALWLSNDIDLENNFDWEAGIFVPQPLSHAIYLALGFRVGYNSQNLKTFIDNSKVIGRDYKSGSVTNLNVGYFSRLFGIEWSASDTDISLRYALGGLDLRQLLNATAQSSSTFETTDSDYIDKAYQGLDENAVCQAAVSYYFPVAVYTTQNFGNVASGVGKPEDIRLADGLAPLELYEGEDAVLHEINMAEANAGNADAQMWMAMRYFWGYGGIQPNLAAARRLIEHAAAANHPEGLYNLGVLHQNGMAGFPVDHQLARQYFQRAADHERPFNMALHAIGNYYLIDSGKEPANITKAIEYYVKAVLLGSSDACYSLATLVRSSIYFKNPDINLAMFLYAKGASHGHVRSVKALAHALWDAESWLGEYIRNHDAKDEVETTEQDNLDHLALLNVSDVLSNETLSTIGYNSSEPLIVLLPGAKNYIELPYPLYLSCSAALEMFKYLAEHSFRIRDVSRAAYDEFMSGDIWMALDYYDEAADLGSAAAQENAAYLYELVVKAECGPESGVDRHSTWRTEFDAEYGWLINRLNDNHILKSFKRMLNLRSIESDYGQTAHGKVDKRLKYLPNLEGKACSHYYEKMATLRQLQLLYNGDPSAMKTIADKLIVGSYPFREHVTSAALLYGMAADLGDVHSMMSLGWLFYSGAEGLQRNLSISARLFASASKWEVMGEALLGHSIESTGGLAPTIAWWYVSLADILCLDKAANITFNNMTQSLLVVFSSEAFRDTYFVNYSLVLLIVIFGYTLFILIFRRRNRAVIIDN